MVPHPIPVTRAEARANAVHSMSIGQSWAAIAWATIALTFSEDPTIVIDNFSDFQRQMGSSQGVTALVVASGVHGRIIEVDSSLYDVLRVLAARHVASMPDRVTAVALTDIEHTPGELSLTFDKFKNPFLIEARLTGDTVD